MIGRGREQLRRGTPAFAALLAGCGALALGATCTTKGDGLILVELSASAQLSGSTPLDHARVVVASQTDLSMLGMATADWPATPPLRLGVYVPKSVSGTVDVIACGFDASGNLIASTPTDQASVQTSANASAQSAIVMITLAPGASPALCGALGTGGHGGGGGGTSGTGGATGGSSAGGTSGTGGATGGTGGSAGTGGATGGTGGSAGGASGSGGAPGGHGGSMDGTVGTGGSAGTGGAIGTAGRGGAGGTGGVAGTGGSGTGGGGPTWQGAVAAATVAATSQTLPSVAVDKNGNAVVIYQQDGQIWSSRYDFASRAWGTPTPVDSRGGQNRPAIAVDKNGNYLAIWNLQTNSSLQGVWQSTSANGTTWTTPTSITQTTAVSPVLSMNANGAAVVAWDEVSSNLHQAAASIRTAPGQAWSTPQVMRPADDSADRNVVVGMAGNGNAFVGWEQTDGVTNYNSVWMRQYTAGSGWGAAALFESYTDNGTGSISIATNTTGDAIVTYAQVSNTNPATIQLWARRYSQLTMSFATNPSKVYEAGDIESVVSSPSVALDDAGNATVAFAVQTGTGYEVQTSRTAPTDPAWPAVPTAMETDDVAKKDDPNSTIAYVTMPVLATDPAGNVTLVWRKRTSASGTRFDLVSRRYAGGAWSPQILLETNTTNSVFWPALAVGANGTAVTAWYFANTLDVWANVYR